MDQTLPERRLALNAEQGNRAGGRLDRAVEVTIIKLLAVATASLKRTKRVLFAARHPIVEERINIRYRRGSLVTEPDLNWSVATKPHRGIAAYSVMEEHLRVLGGERSEDGFFIPRPEADLGDGRNRLAKLKRELDAALAHVPTRRFIEQRSHFAKDPDALERSLLRCQEALNDCMSQLGRPRGAGRAPNVSSDAAIVMLAGCWWLVTGRWPPVSMQTKGLSHSLSRGHFYDWALSSLKRLNPDLASYFTEEPDLETDFTNEYAIYHALKRYSRGRSMRNSRGRSMLLGPWLARDVVDRKGAPKG